MDKKNEINKAIIKVKIKGLNIFSGKPPIYIKGKSMAIVATVPAKTGLITSFVPFLMAV